MTRLTSARASLTLIVALAWPVTKPARRCAPCRPKPSAGSEGGAATSGDFMKARLNAFTVMLNLLDRLGPAR